MLLDYMLKKCLVMNIIWDAYEIIQTIFVDFSCKIIYEVWTDNL